MPAQNPFPAKSDITGYQVLARTCSEVDRVWLYNGNFIKQMTLVNVPTIGYPLNFVITYNGLDTVDGPLGNKFRHNYMMTLDIVGSPPTQVTYTSSGGRQYGFLYDSDTDTWAPDGMSYFYRGGLSQVGDTWQLTFPNGSYVAFDAGGTLTEMVDSHGNPTTIATVDGNLVITEPTGRTLVLGFESGLITSVTDPRGNSAVLCYTDGNLTTVMTAAGCTMTYGWTYLSTYGQYVLTSRTDTNGTYAYAFEDSIGLPTSGRLTSVTDAESNSISYAYQLPTDTSPDAATEFLEPVVPPTVFTTTFLTDAFGNTWQYDFDTLGNLWKLFEPSLTESDSQATGHWRYFYWDSNQMLLFWGGGYPLTFDIEDTQAPGPWGSINNVFHRYAYDNDGTTTATNGNSQGLLLYEADEVGMVTAYTYDDRQNRTSVYPGQAHLGVQGNWIGQYGSQGYVLCNFTGNDTGQDLINPPAYIDTDGITLTPAADVTITQSWIDPSAIPPALVDGRSLQAPTGPTRSVGFWSANGTYTIALPFSGDSAQAFNLSIYTNSVDQSHYGSAPLLYWEQFGRDITFTVTDSTETPQVFRVTNNAPGVWVTFPVHMDPEGTLTIQVAPSGVNAASSSPDVGISALAFDPYDSRRTTWTYSDENDPLTMTDPLGNETSATYNDDGTVASITDANDHTYQLYYEDAYQNLTRWVDPTGNTTLCSYDLNSNPLSQTDANGHVWTATWDDNNRPLTQSNPLLQTTTWAYTGTNLDSITDANGHATSFTWTACGRLETSTSPTSDVTTLGYDGAGNVVSIEDPRTNTTSLAYDVLMRLLSITRPDGNRILFSRDALDRLRAVTPPNGNVDDDSLSSINTVNAGNLVANGGAETVDPFNSTQAQAWSTLDGHGLRDTSQHYTGVASLKVESTTSEAFLQASVPVPVGVRTLLEYVAMTDTAPDTLTLQPAAELAQVTGATASSTGTSWSPTSADAWQAAPASRFDVPGEAQYDRFPMAQLSLGMTSSVDQNAWFDAVSLCSLSYARSYDGVGRPVQDQNPAGSVTTRIRDRFGRVMAIVDARGQETVFTRDSLGRILTVTTPLGESSAWTYDAVGNVASFEDPNVNLTQYTHDSLNRLTVITYPDDSTELFSYDPVSNLTGYTDNNSQSRSLSYDTANRLFRIGFASDSTTVAFQYDPVGNVLFWWDRNGDMTGQTFDASNRLLSVERTPSGTVLPLWSQVNTYDPNSNRTEFENGLPSTYSEYDVAEYDEGTYLAPTVQWQPPASGAQYNTLNQLLAWRDGLNNLTQLGYDPIESRLSTVDCPNDVDTAISYDIMGRIVALASTLSDTTLLALAYAYDLTSNRTGLATLTDGVDYGLDADNRLVQEDINRFVQRSSDRFATGTGQAVDTLAGTVTILAFNDSLEASTLDLDRWRLSYAAPAPSFLGFEIREDATGLHLASPRGYNNQTGFFNVDTTPASTPPYPSYGAGWNALYWGGVEHRQQLLGDFDVQVYFADYQCFGRTGTDIGGGLSLLVADTPMEQAVPTPVNAVQMGLQFISDLNASKYQAAATISSTTTTYPADSFTTDVSGGFRIVRASGVVTFYTLVDDVWTAFSPAPSVPFDVSSPLYVMLVLQSQNLAMAGSFNTFVFNAVGDSYPASGVYTSALYDAGPVVAGGNPVWDSLTWEATTPMGTSLEFQVSIGDDADPTAAVYVGPGGTTSTYYTSSGTSLPDGTTGRYASYQATLSGNGTATPTLTRVDLLYNGTSTNGSSAMAYGYDPASNLVSKVTETAGADTVTETRTVNSLNQIVSNVVVAGNTTTTWDYTFDLNGNTLTKSNGTDTTTYTWNDQDRLTLVTLPDDSTVAYTMDFFGRMLTRTDTSGTTTFVWDGMDCVQETDADGHVTRYVIPNGMLMSFDIDGTVYQVHWDAQGHVRMVTDSDGTVVAQYDYDAWGNPLPSTFDDIPYGGLAYRYVGALGVRWDAGTGLYYMRARWYDPGLGRFLGRDPVRKANRYPYAANNPVRYEDPIGRDPRSSWSQAWANFLDWREGFPIESDPGSNPQGLLAGTSWSIIDAANGNTTFYGPGALQSIDMMNSPLLTPALNAYAEKNLGQSPCNQEPFTDYGISFGPFDVPAAILNGTQEFVGTYNVNIFPLGNGQVEIDIENATSVQSWLYQSVGPNWNMPYGSPEGTQYQIYQGIMPAPVYQPPDIYPAGGNRPY